MKNVLHKMLAAVFVVGNFLRDFSRALVQCAWESSGGGVPGRAHAIAPGFFPNVEAFKAHFTQFGNAIEIIRQDLYDTVLYPTAGMVSLSFFQTPQGQGLSASQGNANAVKALSDTNMTLGGQLQKGQAFYIAGVSLDFQPGSVNTANTFTLKPPVEISATQIAATDAGFRDVSAFYTTGALVLNIGQKPYLQEAPLLKFPPTFRFEADVAAATDSDGAALWVAGKMRAGGERYNVNPGLTLTDGQAFNVTLQWPVVVATPSGFNGAVRTTLHGWLARPVQ